MQQRELMYLSCAESFWRCEWWLERRADSKGSQNSALSTEERRWRHGKRRGRTWAAGEAQVGEARRR